MLWTIPWGSRLTCSEVWFLAVFIVLAHPCWSVVAHFRCAILGVSLVCSSSGVQGCWLWSRETYDMNGG